MFMFYFIPCKKNFQLITTLFSVYSQSFLKDVLSESSSFKIRSKKKQSSKCCLTGREMALRSCIPLFTETDQISSVKKAKMQTVKKMACRQIDKFKSGVSYQGVIGPSMYCQKNALNCWYCQLCLQQSSFLTLKIQSHLLSSIVCPTVFN